MKPTPITTEEEYEEALEQAWELMDAESDEDVAKLSELIARIEVYEDEHYPMNYDPEPAVGRDYDGAVNSNYG